MVHEKFVQMAMAVNCILLYVGEFTSAVAFPTENTLVANVIFALQNRVHLKNRIRRRMKFLTNNKEWQKSGNEISMGETE